MLTLPPAVKEAAATENPIWSPLVRVDFKDGISRFGVGDMDIVTDRQTWVVDSDLVALSPVSAQRVPDQDLFDVTFADPVHPDRPTRWIDKFTIDNSYVGIKIWVGLSFWHKQKWTPSVTIYTGICIQVLSTEGTDGGQITVGEFAGPLVRLEDNPPIKLTRANLKKRSQSDTYLDYVHISRNLQFGKKV